MKIYNSLYIIVLTITALFITFDCRSNKLFTCVFNNPLGKVYDSLSHQDSITVKNIKAYVKYIDSLADNDENQMFVIKSIAEGTVKQEKVTTSIVENSNKIDTIREIKTGGFGKYTTSNIQGDTVFKIHYHDNLKKNFYETYYYEHNKLVYSRIDYKENGGVQTFYYKEEFYKGNRILLSNESSKSIDRVFRLRVEFDLQKKGYTYFADFQANRN